MSNGGQFFGAPLHCEKQERAEWEEDAIRRAVGDEYVGIEPTMTPTNVRCSSGLHEQQDGTMTLMLLSVADGTGWPSEEIAVHRCKHCRCLYSES